MRSTVRDKNLGGTFQQKVGRAYNITHIMGFFPEDAYNFYGLGCFGALYFMLFLSLGLTSAVSSGINKVCLILVVVRLLTVKPVLSSTVWVQSAQERITAVE